MRLKVPQGTAVLFATALAMARPRGPEACWGVDGALASAAMRRLPAVLAVLTVLAAVLLGATPASGAGFFLTDRGAAALARGGANTVAADDLNAAYFNPALIGRGDKGILTYLDLGLIHQSVSFKRTLDEATSDLYPTCCSAVENEAPPFLDPSLMVGWAPEGEKYAVALSVYGPYAGLPEYPKDGDQRYSLVSIVSILLQIQATVSYEITDDFRIGVGFQSRDFALKQRQVISSFPGFLGGPEDRNWDSLVELDVADRFNPGAVIGVWGRVAPDWEVGASWQTPMSVEAEGDLRVEVAGHYMFATTFLDGSKIKLTTELPQVARGGVRYVPDGKGWDAEVDVVWEGWSVHQNVVVTPTERIRLRSVAGVSDYDVQSFTVKDGFQDSFSVRLGGSVDGDHFGWDDVTLRMGAFWEGSAIPEENLTVQAVDADKVGVGLGVKLQLAEGFKLDLGYGHVFLASRNVTNSVRRQVNTLYAQDNPLRTEGRTIVGNGRYESSYHALALTLGASF